MITLVVILMIFAIMLVFILDSRKQEKISSDEAMTLLMFPLMLVGTFLGLQIGVSSSDITTSTHTETTEVQAVTLIDGSRVEGARVNYINEDTGELEQADASISVVLEDSFDTDTVEITYRSIDNSILSFLFSFHGKTGKPEAYIFKVQELQKSRVDH